MQRNSQCEQRTELYLSVLECCGVIGFEKLVILSMQVKKSLIPR